MAFKGGLERYTVGYLGYATPCWEWLGATVTGYGHVGHGDGTRGTVLAHRAMYERHVGPIPDGFELHHLCEVRRCVNPDHLVAVTRLEHARFSRAARKTRCTNGHPYDEANTYIRPNGGRDCRTCIRARVRAYKQRLAA